MYTLNPNDARQADELSSRIEQPGQYIGVITRAEDVTSRHKGARGIDFAFETADRQTGHFTIWTTSGEGKATFGSKQLSALLTCLELRNIAAHDVMSRNTTTILAASSKSARHVSRI